MFYRTCPVCGAALDPGEKCDCTDEKAQKEANDPKCQRPSTTVNDR